MKKNIYRTFAVIICVAYYVVAWMTIQNNGIPKMSYEWWYITLTTAMNLSVFAAALWR